MVNIYDKISIDFNSIIKQMTNTHTIYMASPMFSTHAQLYNSIITKHFESHGYTVLLPQRDGFLFKDLAETLASMGEDEKTIRVGSQTIIYYLDMGYFLNTCDIVLANFDEPLDPGIMIESSYAKIMGKYTIGYRTDVRSPYGNPNTQSGGSHFFGLYQCDEFFIKHITENPILSVEERVEKLISEFIKKIDTAELNNPEVVQKNIDNNPILKHITNEATFLFDGLTSFNSPKNIQLIVSRYLENPKRFNIRAS